MRLDRDPIALVDSSFCCQSHQTLTRQGVAQEEDVQAAMLLFDKNGTGDMSKHEFVQGLEAMKSFAST